jgi:pyruvate/2-oxoglutarate dehydrogenase complex dihydrolipoamide acyltransferase (E2) component
MSPTLEHASGIVKPPHVAANGAQGRLSPVVRKLVAEHALDIGEIAGTGRDGRITRNDVLDRDYLTVPADEIKDIKPLMTMVGGRIVYEAK